MFRQGWWTRWLAAGVIALAAVALALGRGVGGAARAETLARGALRQLGYVAAGDPTVQLEGNHALAWALERSRPGPAGTDLAQGEGGALRWRVTFAGGGEAVVAVDGVLLSVRRPAPTNPGPDLYPTAAKELFDRTLAAVVQQPSAWRWEHSQTWREAGHTWHRARYLDAGNIVPSGWRRELEMELAGSTPITVRHRVHPLGTDLGVVMGRIAELKELRLAGLVGVAILAVGMLLAGVEAMAYHEPLRVARGVLVGALAAGCGWLAGEPAEVLAVQGLVTAGVVALLPTWAFLPRSRLAWGAPAGIALAAIALVGPMLVNGFGGWMPSTPALPDDLSPAHLLGAAWFPALAEEPLLRGAFPGLLGPVLGWWGAAIAGACLGALFHPLPSVPLVAAIGVELVIQLGLVAVARVAGVGGAVVARATLGSIVYRLAYPAGVAWDAVAFGVVALGALLILLRRERE